MNNWNIIHNQAPEHMRDFIRMIPAVDLNSRSLEEAIAYVKTQYAQFTKRLGSTNTAGVRDLGASENPYKFTQLRDRVNVSHVKKECAAADLNDALATKNNEKIKKISAEATLAIAGHFENLPKTITPLINFQSITLPRRTVLLDTRNRNLSNSAYSWDISSIGAKVQGQVNSRDTISQIVEVRCSPFRIPIIGGQNMLYYKKIRLGIAEFDNQGIEIISNSNYITRNYYHFDFTATVDGNYLELAPVASWYPSKIITMCDTITFNFYGNTEKIVFPADRLFCTYAAGAPIVITAPEPHYLNTGDLIYADGTLYNDQGYIVAVLSATQFLINSSAAAPGTSTIYFASRRIQVRLDFVCLEN